MIPSIILGLALAAVGVFVVVRQIKKFRNGEKDPLGLVTRFLVSGIIAIVIGLLIVIKICVG